MGLGPVRNASDAAKALEATFLRQMIESSGAFKGNSMAGSELQSQMFVDALADAVEARGGIGLARMVEDALPASAESEATAAGEAADPAGELAVGEAATSGLPRKVTNRPLALKTYQERADLLSDKRPIRVAKEIGHDH